MSINLLYNNKCKCFFAKPLKVQKSNSETDTYQITIRRKKMKIRYILQIIGGVLGLAAMIVVDVIAIKDCFSKLKNTYSSDDDTLLLNKLVERVTFGSALGTVIIIIFGLISLPF